MDNELFKEFYDSFYGKMRVAFFDALAVCSEKVSTEVDSLVEMQKGSKKVAKIIGKCLEVAMSGIPGGNAINKFLSVIVGKAAAWQSKKLAKEFVKIEANLTGSLHTFIQRIAIQVCERYTPVVNQSQITSEFGKCICGMYMCMYVYVFVCLSV